MDKAVRMFRLRGLQYGGNSRIIRKIFALNQFGVLHGQ
jgi:hypothetical protein